MGATERVKVYLENKGITKYAFYKQTGFSNKFLDNSSNMGTDRAEIILRHYPDLNPVWLLTGEGEMLKTKPYSFPEIEIPIVGESEVTYGGDKDIIASLIESNRKLIETNRRLVESQVKLIETNSKLMELKEPQSKEDQIADAG
ncbi:MAG: hypothetical protein LUE98_07680 [Tannerellaceae bacterium]|nr:hypothetical protein [Tannerellaceae bacterium]